MTMMTTPYQAVDLYIDACYKSDDAGMDYALSLLGSVHTTLAERRSIRKAHIQLRDSCTAKLKVIDQQITRGHVDDAELDEMLHRRDQLTFDYYMWSKLVDYLTPMV